jgi:hypothetical protein
MKHTKKEPKSGEVAFELAIENIDNIFNLFQNDLFNKINKKIIKK